MSRVRGRGWSAEPVRGTPTASFLSVAHPRAAVLRLAVDLTGIASPTPSPVAQRLSPVAYDLSPAVPSGGAALVRRPAVPASGGCAEPCLTLLGLECSAVETGKRSAACRVIAGLFPVSTCTRMLLFLFFCSFSLFFFSFSRPVDCESVDNGDHIDHGFYPIIHNPLRSLNFGLKTRLRIMARSSPSAAAGESVCVPVCLWWRTDPCLYHRALHRSPRCYAIICYVENLGRL